VKAVVLVGGEGTRLRPLTHHTVKAMVPILNRPFLEYLLQHLANHSVDEVILAMGYKPDSIQNHFTHAHGLPVKLVYSIEPAPLGTAGAVKYAEQYLDNTFFVLNGDVFTTIDLTAMLRFHKESGAKITIALTPVEDPTRFGVVETDNRFRIKKFIEKPPPDQVTTNNINAGVYILEKDALKNIPSGRRVMFEHDVFPELLSAGDPLYAYPTDAYWIDIGTLENYHRLNCDLLTGKCPHPDPKTVRPVPPESSFVHPQARVQGPVLIGERCRIGYGVQIIGPAVIGTGCHIEDCAIIEKSILWQHVTVGKNAILRNCIVASNSCIASNSALEGVTITPEHKTP